MVWVEDLVLVILYFTCYTLLLYHTYCLSVYRLGTTITLLDLLCFLALHMCCLYAHTRFTIFNPILYRNVIAVLNGANNKEYIHWIIFAFTITRQLNETTMRLHLCAIYIDTCVVQIKPDEMNRVILFGQKKNVCFVNIFYQSVFNVGVWSFDKNLYRTQKCNKNH